MDDDASRVLHRPVLEFGRLAAEFGLRYFEMQRDWARWAIEQYRLIMVR